MSVRGIGDAFAYQRLLWLLIGTVVLPTVLLALYGVMAIRDQRSAYVERVREQQQERLQWASDALEQRVEEVANAAGAGTVGCSGLCDVELKGVTAIWVWDPASKTGPVEVPRDLTQSPSWWSDDGQPYGALVRGNDVVAFRLDGVALGLEMSALTHNRFADHEMTFRMVSQVFSPFAEPTFVADLPLQAPFTEHRVAVFFSEESAAGSLFTRTAWVYTLGLVALVTLVLVGTVLTLGTASREIRLSRLQTDFVSSVSHDLRTPLTSIRMFVDTLQSGRLRDPERIDEILGLMSEETERLSRLIERVLGWARMEAGRRSYEQEPVSARALVEDALRALRTQHLLTDVGETEIEVKLPDGLPLLLVDRDAIVEALLNLLTNAVKYAPAPRKIEVSVRRRRKRLGLCVTDNGPGIARGERKRVWEKFYQSDHRLSAPQQGSGLGLAIVRAVVRGHGGRVELVSETGQGASFTLWLPAARA
jgi:signal transduction histidine kinase